VVAFGFPFEIITQPATRTAIMDRVLDSFAIQAPPMDLVVTVAGGQTIVDSDVRSGDVRLVKRGAGRLVIERANAFTGGTLIEDGEVVVRHVEALAAGSVTLRGQGRLTLDIGVERLSLPVLDMAATTRIDVGFGGLTIAAVGIAEDQLVALLRTARGDGDWAASPAGIGSAFAAAGSGRGVGFVRDESASISVAFAAAGDVNLDGVVDILDVSALLADGGYDTATPAGWATGDFTFDGVVDILDVSELFAAAAFDAGSYLPSGSLTRRRLR
jgi:autotransporter-associated beta strand protein